MNLELMAKAMEGEASLEERARLAEEMGGDPDSLAKYLELVEVHALLGVALEDDQDAERFARKILGAVAAEKRTVRGPAAWFAAGRRQVAGVAAALALLAAGWWYWAATGKVEVRGEYGVTLAHGGVTVRKQLQQRRTLGISAGLVELKIGNKGTMIVEGPADLELPGRGRAILRRGKLVMRVTPSGQGYEVLTPAGKVVDLGTEFAVEVGENGNSEVHVLKGMVETRVTGKGKVLLKRDQALRLDDGTRIRTDPRKFYTALPPVPSRTAAVGFVHWPMDEGSGLTSKAEAKGMPADRYDLRLLTMEQGNVPRWAPGRFGQGLAFDGRGAFLESGYTGMGESGPRTVCLWVKLPREFSQGEGFPLVSWGRYHHEDDDHFWQIAVNSVREDGPIGNIRVSAHGGRHTIGTTDLRDGEWHHLAVVLCGGSSVEMGTQVVVYIDGKLERLSNSALGEKQVAPDSADHGLRLGRSITHVQRMEDHWHGGFFRGDLDEVYLFRGALSQEEIVTLKDHNEPPR